MKRQKQNHFLSTNIKKLRLRRFWSQDAVAKKVGTSRAKIAFIETSKTENPPIGDIVNLSVLFGIPVDVLLKVDLSSMSEAELVKFEAGGEAYAAGTALRILATTVDKDNNENIELVPEKAKAGYRSGYADPEFIAGLPRYTLPGLSKHRKYRIFPISGDSMIPYPDGCYIVGEYVEDWMELKNDTLCVLVLKSQGADFVFKQVINQLKQNNSLLAKSLNPIYKPYEIPVTEVLEVWRYAAHFATTIATVTPEKSLEHLLEIVQEMKMDIAKLTVNKPRRA